MKSGKSTNSRQLTSMGIFTALLVICSWIKLPLAIPVTMQTFGIFLMILILKTKRSMYAYLTYLLLGIIGIPVFSGFGAGPSVLLGPTGGYLTGFLFTILISGTLIKILGTKTPAVIFSLSIGLIACYVSGTIMYMFIYARNTESSSLASVLMICVVPFIIPDILKLCLSVIVWKRLRHAISGYFTAC